MSLTEEQGPVLPRWLVRSVRDRALRGNSESYRGYELDTYGPSEGILLQQEINDSSLF